MARSTESACTSLDTVAKRRASSSITSWRVSPSTCFEASRSSSRYCCLRTPQSQHSARWHRSSSVCATDAQGTSPSDASAAGSFDPAGTLSSSVGASHMRRHASHVSWLSGPDSACALITAWATRTKMAATRDSICLGTYSRVVGAGVSMQAAAKSRRTGICKGSSAAPTWPCVPRRASTCGVVPAGMPVHCSRSPARARAVEHPQQA